MARVNIPPVALEAGARALAIAKEGSDEWWTLHMRAARAAFETMVAAWPGSFEEYMNVEEGRAVVCMILPKGGTDDQ